MGRGTWNPIVPEHLWELVQDILDDPARITNRAGTHRRHLGSGLHLCGVCNEPVQGAAKGYRCRTTTHLSRTGPPIDDLVRAIVVLRLQQPDALGSQPVADSPKLAAIAREMNIQRAHIARAQRDSDEDKIEAEDMTRVRRDANAAIESPEREQLRSARGATVPLLGVDDPSAAS